jgi:hypothetical protein
LHRGVVLYLPLVRTILVRWLAFPVTPATVGGGRIRGPAVA